MASVLIAASGLIVSETPVAATPLPNYTAAVLSPLYQMTPAELAAFSAQLPTLKANGVTAIETDLWWGLFEPARRGYDWAYYVDLAQRVNAAGLKWIPILSFHECGPNPNDSCRGPGPMGSIPLPSWVDAELMGEDRSLRACAFVDERGFENTEYIAPWCDDIARPWYEEAMASFATTFSPLASGIQRVHIGLGPSGELRYPSYFNPAGWSYPQRGLIQAYSELAKRGFRDRLVALHGGIAGVNARWGTAYASINDVVPPGLPGAPRTVDEMYSEVLQDDRYVRDFWHWYAETLNVHGALLILDARGTITVDGQTGLGEKMEVAGKIAGIHWQLTKPGQVRAAEFAAGYWHAPGSVPYQRILAHLGIFGASVVFTAVELGPDRGAPNFSDPPRVVRDVAAAAKNFGMKLYAENALPINGDPAFNEDRYDRAALHLFNLGFSGFSLLRMNDLLDPITGAPRPPLAVFRDRIGIRPVPQIFEIVVPAGTLGLGESICLTGGTSGRPPERGPRTELGAWTAEFCTPMVAGAPRMDGSIPFSVSVHLSENRDFNYKYRVIDAVGSVTGRFNPAPDATCSIPLGGRGPCITSWN